MYLDATLFETVTALNVDGHVTENYHGNIILQNKVCLLTLSVTWLNWSLTTCSKRRLNVFHPALNRRAFENNNQINFKIRRWLQNNYIIIHLEQRILFYFVCVCIYIPHISPIVSWQFYNSSIGWHWTSACKDASGSRYQSIL